MPIPPFWSAPSGTESCGSYAWVTPRAAPECENDPEPGRDDPLTSEHSNARMWTSGVFSKARWPVATEIKDARSPHRPACREFRGAPGFTFGIRESACASSERRKDRLIFRNGPFARFGTAACSVASGVAANHSSPTFRPGLQPSRSNSGGRYRTPASRQSRSQ